MFVRKITVLFLLFCSFATNKTDDKTDLIIFSYDRPMQLYALLESVEQYVTGAENICVVYRASDERFEQSYQSVKEDFDKVVFCGRGMSRKKILSLSQSLFCSRQRIITYFLRWMTL